MAYRTLLRQPLQPSTPTAQAQSLQFYTHSPGVHVASHSVEGLCINRSVKRLFHAGRKQTLNRFRRRESAPIDSAMICRRTKDRDVGCGNTLLKQSTKERLNSGEIRAKWDGTVRPFVVQLIGTNATSCTERREIKSHSIAAQ